MRNRLTMRCGERVARAHATELDANRRVQVLLEDEDGQAIGVVNVRVFKNGTVEVATDDVWAKVSEPAFLKLARARDRQLREAGIAPARLAVDDGARLRVRVR